VAERSWRRQLERSEIAGNRTVEPLSLMTIKQFCNYKSLSYEYHIFKLITFILSIYRRKYDDIVPVFFNKFFI